MSLPEEILRGQTPVARALVGAIQRAKRFCITNPDEAQNIVASQLDLPVEVVKTAWPKHNWSATLTDDVLTDIRQKAEFLAEQKLTPNNVVPSLQALVDASLIKK